MIKNLILDDTLRESEIDPSAPQKRASDPVRHSWVRASAGSGKTKVLTDRILRLLLPDPILAAPEIVPGVPPEKILCLTFTKAGAAEMRLRLQKRLLDWAVMADDELKKDLIELIGVDLPAGFLSEAKKLFAKLLEAPAKIQILTIHSFCQSILGRFPIETDLAPDFKVIEEFEERELQEKSLQTVLNSAVIDPESSLKDAFMRLSLSQNMAQLQNLLKKILNEPLKLLDFLDGKPDLNSIRTHLTKIHNDGRPLTTLPIICSPNDARCENLKALSALLLSGTKSNHEPARIIFDWLAADVDTRIRDFSSFKAAITRNPLGKLKDDPSLQSLRAQELDLLDQLNLANDIASTADLIYVASLIHREYTKRKTALGVLDYNDLIFETRKLLSGDFWAGDQRQKELATSWVLYKLDEGIDHILVDESQDTNPDQWKIIDLLSQDFFSGAARPALRPRSFFVVGDEKQSIFSFQRADPEIYREMREYFARKVEILQDSFEESFLYSFRTTLPVLKFVDATFNINQLQSAIGLDPDTELRHYSHRTQKKGDTSGSVELYPVVKPEDKPEETQNETGSWKIPFGNQNQSPPPAQRLASQIATQIHMMIQKGEAEPQDFMILMQTRSALMLHLIRELKRRLIPVSGIDRLILNDSLIMQDILALIDFILLRENDFALACFLKSPFIGMNEEALMELAINRGDASMWERLRTNAQYKDTVAWFENVAAFSGRVQPYEFLDFILTKPCPADPQGSGYRACQARLGPDIIDPLDEILNEALKLELQDIRTLQEFSERQRKGQREIKRQLEESSNQVRIMTVHASKGLEANIVILPDTTSVPGRQKLDKFIWADQKELQAPLWSVRTETASLPYKKARDRLAMKQQQESARLLYVAMTRARDRLMVYGFQTKAADLKPECWYAYMEKGLSELPFKQDPVTGLKIYCPAPSAPKDRAVITPVNLELPDWLRKSAPNECEAPGILTPSQQSMADEPVYSPLDQSRQNRFRRGLVTHRLLQVLPDTNPDFWESAARSFASRKAFDLSPDIQDSIVQETLRILTDAVFKPVFMPGSLAEVPITGEVNGKIVNGQIDRLIVTDHEILIVDYKTNRPSPQSTDTIPTSYKAQLKAYSDTLRLIYPDRPVKAALLWTDQPLLMPVDVS